MPEAITVNLAQYQLAGLRWGSADKPPLIALHGWLDNAASFTYLAPLLAQHYHVIALDLPGHGESDHLPTAADYQHVQLIEPLLEAFDVLQYSKITLVGHSLGGVVASLFASSFPERVERLVMIDSIGPLSEEAMNSPAHLAKSIKRILRQGPKAQKTYPQLQMMVEARMRASGFSEREARPIVERNTKTVDGGYQWRFDRQLLMPSLNYFTEAQVQAHLRAIQVPCLLVEAEQGLIHNNELITERKKVFQNLQTEVLKGHHHIHLQHPDKIALAICRFLSDNLTN